MKMLNGKKAVIIGGSEGIDAAIEKSYAENGSDIMLIFKNTKNLTYIYK